MIRRKRLLEDLDRDIREHIEHETRDNIERGMSPEEARQAALRKFGNVTRVKEDTRAVWIPTWIEQLLQDVRYGVRMLRRNPGFTAVVILTLALGIGMNTAVFSVVNAVLLRPVAYPSPDRLVWLAQYDRFYESWRDNFVSRADYLIWRDQAHSFESMAAYGNRDLALLASGESSQERIASITGDFWSITGARPMSGRLFRPGERNTMVLSHGLFERRFGGDPQLIGKTVTVNGYSFTITGVLPMDFRFLLPQQFAKGDEQREIDAFIPIPDASERPGEEITQSLGPAPFWVCVLGKLRPNASIDRARAEMETIYARIAFEYPTVLRKHSGLRVAMLQEKLAGNARLPLMILLAAVGFVLLIACANVANLLLARASTRQREIAIRAALGAGRGRVMRQFLAESVVLALFGGAAGLILARWALIVMVRLGPQSVPRLDEARIDGWALAFTSAASLLASFLFGLAPALSLWRANKHCPLKDDPRTSSAGVGRFRVQGFLVAAELALSIVLLTGAGLMLKSFWNMNANPSGFAPEKILVMRVSLSGPAYATRSSKATYVQELLRRIESAPGVQAVGIECGTLNTAVKVEGAPPVSAERQPLAAVRFVSPGYLRAIGVPLIKGQWPAGKESLFAIMVNESFVRRMSGAGDPTGRHIGGGFLSGTIEGVVADFKYWKLDAEPAPEVYYPYERSPLNRSTRVIVRTSGDAAVVAPAIRKLVSDIDRTQPVYELQTLEQALSDSIAPRRFNMFLLGTFAFTALIMALIGIYGVIAYSVTQRTHEIGIRMALGAQRGEVVRMVVRQGMVISLVGIVLGMIAAAGLTRLMESLLYDVKPNDPQTFASVALLLVTTALAACWGPALRASLVDPIIALRYE